MVCSSDHPIKWREGWSIRPGDRVVILEWDNPGYEELFKGIYEGATIWLEKSKFKEWTR
jgi:hypothetical protein